MIKIGVGVEDIVLSSNVNIESVKGIDKAVSEKKRENKDLSELKYTSAPHKKLVDSKNDNFKLGVPKNEVDLSRAFVKPSAVCFFASVPMNISQKKNFIILKKIAKKHSIPVMIVNLTALNKEKTKEQTLDEI